VSTLSTSKVVSTTYETFVSISTLIITDSLTITLEEVSTTSNYSFFSPSITKDTLSSHTMVSTLTTSQLGPTSSGTLKSTSSLTTTVSMT
jgi:hypothetical protein